jgi:D-apionolactonase
VSSPSPEILRTGLSPPLELTELHAGPLRVLFEPGSGALRSIYLGPAEVLRGISAPVRDRNWGTVPPAVSRVKIEQGRGRFRVEFQVDCRQGDVDFSWQGAIVGTAAGTVRFIFTGRARTAFLKNRIGFCILHPSEICAGLLARVRTTGGELREGVFPKLISPHQPFLDMAMIEHPVASGVWARVEMTGDVFEMEDQRNWADASFKTYCTPLARPFPVQMNPGEEIRQEIILSLQGKQPAVPGPRAASPIELKLTDARHPLPAIGVAFDPAAPDLTQPQVDHLRALNLAHLRVDAIPSRPGLRARLDRAAAIARALNTRLEIALLLTADYQKELASLPEIPNARWLLLPAEGPASDHAWARTFPARPGGGTNAFFAELNRNRPPAGAFAEVCWSLNPQVHAFDNRSLAETLLAMGDMVATARAFAPNTWLAVSPVTLKMRFNPNATVASERDPLLARESRVDSRQMSLFGAGFTLGTIAAHAAAGLDSLTLYETHGPCGLLGPTGSPEWFPLKEPALVYPLYHVLAELAPFGGGTFRRVDASPAIAALSAEHNRARALHLANLTTETVTVRLPITARARALTAENAWLAMTQPALFRRTSSKPESTVTLAPYALHFYTWDSP